MVGLTAQHASTVFFRRVELVRSGNGYARDLQDSVRYCYAWLLIPRQQENVGRVVQKCSVGQTAHWRSFSLYAAFPLATPPKVEGPRIIKKFRTRQLAIREQETTHPTTHRQSFHLRTKYIWPSPPHMRISGAPDYANILSHLAVSQRCQRSLVLEVQATDCLLAVINITFISSHGRGHEGYDEASDVE